MLTADKIDKQVEPILRQMEKIGIKLDVKYLQTLNKKVNVKITYLERQIYADVGREFNINSPQQLSAVIFDELYLAGPEHEMRRTKTGLSSTAASELKKLVGFHPSVAKILEYKELFKLKTTYLEPLPKLVDKCGRLHTHFAQDTSTGRLSSSNPNLQNIPIKTQVGNKIRRAFVADEGNVLLCADYSQIELRIAAFMAQDKKMLEAFEHGEDIHAQTAKALGCDRRTAKAVNFGIIYGQGAFGLSRQLNISREMAQEFINRYFATFQGIKQLVEKLKGIAHQKGYAETLFGRQRALPELRSPNLQFRRAAERAAINMPIQGTAADIVKIAMMNISEKRKAKSEKLILQVHDELVFEVPKAQVKKVAPQIKKIMEEIPGIFFPLKVDLSFGLNWYDQKELKFK